MGMIHRHLAGPVYEGKLADFNASPSKYERGAILMPTDSAEIRVANGSQTFSQLVSYKAQAKAAKVTPSGTASTDIAAIITALQNAGLMATT